MSKDAYLIDYFSDQVKFFGISIKKLYSIYFSQLYI